MAILVTAGQLEPSGQSDRTPGGGQIFVTVSRELAAEYGCGFSDPELKRMVQFAQLSRAGNCCDAVATIEAVASACTAADRGPLARDFYAEMCRSERWDVRSKDMNKPTIEPCKASVMTLNGLLMPGIGVSNEPR